MGRVNINSGTAETNPKAKASERVLTVVILVRRLEARRREMNNLVPEPLRK